jgi:hypothetical protein
VSDSAIVEDLADQAVRSREEVMKQLSHQDVKSAVLARAQSFKFEKEVADRIGKEPGFDVPGHVAITILREADCLYYSKVRFEAGPLKGTVGWVFRPSIDDPRTEYP